jgi:hypothetical protein
MRTPKVPNRASSQSVRLPLWVALIFGRCCFCWCMSQRPGPSHCSRPVMDGLTGVQEDGIGSPCSWSGLEPLALVGV